MSDFNEEQDSSLIENLEEKIARLKKKNKDLHDMVSAQELMLSDTTTYLDKQRQELKDQKGDVEVENFYLTNNLEKRNKELVKIKSNLEDEVVQRKQSAQKLAKLNEELNDFMYRTAHDLRTPITNLKGLFYILEASLEPESSAELLSRMNQTTDQLLELLEQLTSVLDIRNRQIEEENFHLRDFFNELFSKIDLPEKEVVSFTNDIDSAYRYHCDPYLFKHIIRPILINAVVFSSSESHPEVSLKFQAKKEYLIIKIKDNGIGIPESFFSMIFKMFYRANHQWDGHGLGLYLSKTAASRLDVTIDFLSSPNNTEFSIIIPKNKTYVAEK